MIARCFNCCRKRRVARFSSLFPALSTSYHKTNLSDVYKRNPHLNMTLATGQDALLQLAILEATPPGHDFKKVCTYGGFGEDRTAMWAPLYEINPSETKSEIPPQRLHLGVDFNNVPVGQSVAALFSGHVFHVFKDPARLNGWGGRVILKQDKTNRYLHSLPVVQTKIQAGDIIGKVALSTTNGGWFTHVHLQLMTAAFLQPFLTNLEALDGYSEDGTIPQGVLDPLTLFPK